MDEAKHTELEREVFDVYMQKTPKSKQMYERACRSFPGGGCGHGRLARPYQLYTTHGRGTRIYDVDGNEYIDFAMGLGSLLLGHGHPEVVEAVKREVERGLLLHNADVGVECAELLTEVIPCADKVRFGNSGTEVLMFAARIARGFTGKNKIIKFYGHYNGQEDQFMIGLRNTDEVMSGGVPREAVLNTVLLPWNDIDAVRRKLDEDKDIAGVLLDPLGCAGGYFPARDAYLKELRELTQKRGVVLIFDEIVSGFRLALGGAQEYYGVTPDLACFAKGMASGARMAALAGRDEVMGILVPAEMPAGITYDRRGKTVFASGTTIESTPGLAAAIATIKVLKRMKEEGEYERLAQRSHRLNSSMADAWRQRGVPCHLTGIGCIFRLHLTDLEPDFDAYCNLDERLFHLFDRSLFVEGVWPSPSLAAGPLLSFVHTDEEIDRAIEAVNVSLDKYNWAEIYHS